MMMLRVSHTHDIIGVFVGVGSARPFGKEFVWCFVCSSYQDQFVLEHLWPLRPVVGLAITSPRSFHKLA